MEFSAISRRSLFIGAGATGAALALGLTGAMALTPKPTAGLTPTGAPSAGYFSADEVHEVSLTIDPNVFQAMLATYLAKQDKEWISAEVTIDGKTYDNVGLRLKGNSSLKGISADSAPEALPWKVKLDEFVEGKNHDGMTSFIIRSNSTTTALNETVALSLLGATGLATDRAAYIALRANGSDAVLRLTVEELDDEWTAWAFPTAGILYKADASGDYSYRGSDAAAYEDVFELEAGEENYVPLIEFLDFVNNSSDEEFKSGLASQLDVPSFTKYLAFQDLVDNFDDISGPGNNSYLWWAQPADQMTVVSWDLNLAFGMTPGGGGQGGMGGGSADGTGNPPYGRGPGGGMPSGAAPGGGMPEGSAPAGAPDGKQMPPGAQTDGQAGSQDPAGGGQRGGQGKANPLVDRYNSLAGGTAAVKEETETLRESLFASGVAQRLLDEWVAILNSGASELVDETDLETEKANIEKYFA